MDVVQLLVQQQHVAVVVFDALLFLVRYEVWGDVAAVERHTVHVLDFVVQGLALLAGDGTVHSHFLVEVADHVTDAPIPVGWDGGHVRDGLLSLDLSRAGFKIGDDVFDCQVDALLQLGGGEASLHFLEALLVDGAGQDGSRGSTVSSFVVGLAGDALD